MSLFWSGNAWTEITYGKKKLYKNFTCDKNKFGMENTINSKNEKVTVWSPLSDKGKYMLPPSIVSAKRDKDFKAVYRFYDHVIKMPAGDNKFNIIIQYTLGDKEADFKNLLLKESMFLLDEDIFRELKKSSDYLLNEMNDKKYTDRLIKDFLKIEKTLSNKKPFRKPIFSSCHLKK